MSNNADAEGGVQGIVSGVPAASLPPQQEPFDINAWLRQNAEKTQQREQRSQPAAAQPISITESTRFGRAVLEQHAEEMAATQPGSRNTELNRHALIVGHYVAGGEINEGEAVAVLGEAARQAGMTEGNDTIMPTIRSGLEAGKRDPQSAPPGGEWGEPAGTFSWDADNGGAGDGDDASSSWHEVDLSGYLDGTFQPPVADLLPRSDGVCLFYRGLTHSLHGESESGKSLVIQAECARVISGDGHVLYVDYESDPASVVQRLLALGATREAIRRCFHYVEPTIDPTRDPAAFLGTLDAHPYDLAVLDGVTEALSQRAGQTNSNDDLTRWSRELPNAIARRTRAAVVQIDHVTKNADTRGRFAIGGQAKMAAITGAAYSVEVRKPLGRGLRGEIVLRVGKDRPGYVREHCGAFRPSDRTQEAARITVDGTTAGRIVVSVDPPVTVDADRPFRPTSIMEKVSRRLEAGGPANRSEFRSGFGKTEYVLLALDILQAEGYITTEVGARNAKLHRHVRPYREVEDAQSDCFAGNRSAVALHESAPLTCSRLKTGNTGTGQSPVPGTGREQVGNREQVDVTGNLCRVCGEPMVDTGEGYDTHPSCIGGLS